MDNNLLPEDQALDLVYNYMTSEGKVSTNTGNPGFGNYSCIEGIYCAAGKSL